MQNPHRRVDEVAHAWYKHARDKRLSHQQEQAAANRQVSGGIAHLVGAELKKTIKILPSEYALDLKEGPVSE